MWLGMLWGLGCLRCGILRRGEGALGLGREGEGIRVLNGRVAVASGSRGGGLLLPGWDGCGGIERRPVHLAHAGIRGNGRGCLGVLFRNEGGVELRNLSLQFFHLLLAVIHRWRDHGSVQPRSGMDRVRVFVFESLGKGGNGGRMRGLQLLLLLLLDLLLLDELLDLMLLLLAPGGDGGNRFAEVGGALRNLCHLVFQVFDRLTYRVILRFCRPDVRCNIMLCQVSHPTANTDGNGGSKSNAPPRGSLWWCRRGHPRGRGRWHAAWHSACSRSSLRHHLLFLLFIVIIRSLTSLEGGPP